MHPRFSQSRPIRSDARPDAPLVYERLSDPILVTRAKAGDEKALAALCERHAPRVERLALHLLRDPEDARDAAQDSLAKLVVRIRQFRGESQFSTWLHRLTVNTCKDFAQARALRRTEPLLADEREARDGDPVSGARICGDAPGARPAPRGAAGRAGEGGRVEGRLRRRLRRDLRGHGLAGRDGQVLRPPRPRLAARAARRMTRRLRTARSGGQRSRRSCRTARRSCSIDEVTELIPGQRVVAKKTVTDEDCAGHFPGNPIMPGVKMVEALAQCGAVAVLSQPENLGKLVLFAGIEDIRFKRIVRPGETLDLTCEVEAVRGPVGKGKVRAEVEGQLAVRGSLTFAVADE